MTSPKQGLRRRTSRNELELARLNHSGKMEHLHHLYGTIRELVRKLPWLALILAFWQVAPAFAGKETVISSNLRFVLSLGANKWFLMGLATLTGSGVMIQQRLRRRSISRNQSHTKRLEKIVDPGRTSSNLKHDGTARQEDLDDA